MRCIDADNLIGLVKDATILGDGFKQAFIAIVRGEPTIEPERKTGKWTPHNDVYEFTNGQQAHGGVMCNRCGYKTHNALHRAFACSFKYCPMCGADMRGEQE